MRIIVLLAVVSAVAARPDADFYDKKYENFNAKELASNDRLLHSYSLCILGKGKCTPEGNDFKDWTPEAIQTNCGKCTEKQKSLIAEVIKAVREKLPNDWEELTQKYNPSGQHTEDLNQFIKQYAPN
ncbi:unnamed protein product, partial [Iphiclides podalirius]